MSEMQSAAIAVATYRRNDSLRRLLQSLASQVHDGWEVRVVVVDNDPAHGAAAATYDGADSFVMLHEPRPGIVAARNRALQELAQQPPDIIVFVDDDEEPMSSDWLITLLESMESWSCDAVIGPVLPAFPPGVSPELVSGGFFERKRQESGTPVGWGTTNNTALRWSTLQKLDSPRFDPDFSESGGSDAELFWRLMRAEASVLWCEEAPVKEYFPADRAQWPWLRRRTRRLGNVSARLKLRDHSRVFVAFLGLSRSVLGTLIILAARLRGRPVPARGFDHKYKGIGMVAECFGRRVREYQRPRST